MQRPIGERRKRGNAQVNTNVSRRRMDRFLQVHLDLEGHEPMLPLSGDGDVFDGALHSATGPELDPTDHRQVDLPPIQFEALGIAEAVGEKLLAITRWCSTTSEEVGIGTFQIFQALLKDLGMHVFEPTVFLALLPPGEQLTGLCIGETWHTGIVAVFVDGQNLVPDKTTRPSKTDELHASRTVGLQLVFIALAYLHRPYFTPSRLAFSRIASSSTAAWLMLSF